MSFMKILLCGLAAVSLAVSAHSQVAYSSFGTGDSYQTNSIWVIGGNVQQITAFQFESATTGVLSTIEYAFSLGSAGDVQVTLFEDSSDEKGAILGSWTQTEPDGFTSSIKSITNTNSGIGLTAGSKYWLQLAPGTSTLAGGWNINDQNLSGRLYLNQSGSGFYFSQRVGAYRVSTSVVPEPASMAALGLGALALIRKRRKSA